MQNFHVLIKGEFCPIVGRVSMDQITVRLPEELPLGTKVTLIGREARKKSRQQRLQITVGPLIMKWSVS